MYFYEHENGEIIKKPDHVVETGGGACQYFDSPFVTRWWHEEDSIICPKCNGWGRLAARTDD